MLLGSTAITQRNTPLIAMVAWFSGVLLAKIIPPNCDLPGWKAPLILIELIAGRGAALSSEG
jgi:hypothetical protein